MGTLNLLATDANREFVHAYSAAVTLCAALYPNERFYRFDLFFRKTDLNFTCCLPHLQQLLISHIVNVWVQRITLGILRLFKNSLQNTFFLDHSRMLSHLERHDHHLSLSHSPFSFSHLHRYLDLSHPVKLLVLGKRLFIL